MLRRLILKEFVIVASSEITFDAGFSVLTGETGAGKSILLDAIGLLLGARADASAVREGAARADLSAEFGLTPALAAWLAERELSGDEDSLLLRRIVEADGRSKALINGHPATASANSNASASNGGPRRSRPCASSPTNGHGSMPTSAACRTRPLWSKGLVRVPPR